MKQDPDDELTVREAEAFYRVSRDTLKRRMRAGELPFTRILGRLYFRRADLERALGVQHQRAIAR